MGWKEDIKWNKGVTSNKRGNQGKNQNKEQQNKEISK